jgi:large subunit ribosomal protein L10
MNREQKAVAIAEIAARIDESQAIFAIDYRGISVSQAAELRLKLRDADATFTVVKNSLTERAADQAGADTLKAFLTGPTALTFVRGDVATAAKAIADYARATQLLPLKGGLMDGAPLDVDQIRSISRLPSREALYAQLVGVVASPVTGLVRTLNALAGGLAVALGQVREKKESGDLPAGPPPVAEAPVEEEPAAAEPAAEGGELPVEGEPAPPGPAAEGGAAQQAPEEPPVEEAMAEDTAEGPPPPEEATAEAPAEGPPPSEEAMAEDTAEGPPPSEEATAEAPAEDSAPKAAPAATPPEEPPVEEAMAEDTAEGPPPPGEATAEAPAKDSARKATPPATPPKEPPVEEAMAEDTAEGPPPSEEADSPHGQASRSEAKAEGGSGAADENPTKEA